MIAVCLVFGLLAGLVPPWGALPEPDAPAADLLRYLEEGRWDEAETGLADLIAREPSALWFYFMGRLEESRGRWWEAWGWYGRAVADDRKPWSTLAASRWVRLEFLLPLDRTDPLPPDRVWAVFPLEALDGETATAAVARALTHDLTQRLRGSGRLHVLGPRQLLLLKSEPLRQRGALSPVQTPGGTAARLALLAAPGPLNVPYLDPSRTEVTEEVSDALARFQLDMGLPATGRVDAETAVALERAVTSWLARETASWPAADAREVARQAGASRYLQGSLRELPEGGYRWSVALLETGTGHVLAGPHEGRLKEGRWNLEIGSAVTTLLGQATGEGAPSHLPLRDRVPERESVWEAWGFALTSEDGRDPVAGARAYERLHDAYGDEDWGLEMRMRDIGWNLPLPQTGTLEEGLLHDLRRDRRDLGDVLGRSAAHLSSGFLPASGVGGDRPPSAPQIVGDEGRLILEGRIP